MARPAKSGGNRALLLATIRQIHVYLGMFIAPSLLLFAVSGGLQLFGLHEAEDGYKPAPIVERLGRAHMNQTFTLRPPRPQAARPAAPAKPGAAAAAEAEEPEAGPKLSITLLKWFFLLVCVGLAVSTLLGVWMGLKFNRRKRLALALLIAGAVLPALLLAL